MRKTRGLTRTHILVQPVFLYANIKSGCSQLEAHNVKHDIWSYSRISYKHYEINLDIVRTCKIQIFVFIPPPFMGSWKHYVFDLSVALCVHTCLPGEGILQPACRPLLVFFKKFRVGYQNFLFKIRQEMRHISEHVIEYPLQSKG